MPGTWERSVITHLTLAIITIITFCLHLSTAPANFIWCSSVLFLQKTRTALTFCPTAFYGPQLSDWQGWSLVNVVVPYITVVVLHLNGPYFFLFVLILKCVITEARGRRQITCDLQDGDTLKMHVHGRIIFFALVSFFFPLTNASKSDFLCLFLPTITDH